MQASFQKAVEILITHLQKNKFFEIEIYRTSVQKQEETGISV